MSTKQNLKSLLDQKANATVSVFGNAVVLAHAFDKLFSKPKKSVLVGVKNWVLDKKLK